MKTENWLLALTAGLVIYSLNEKKKDTNKIIGLNNLNNQLANQNNRLLGVSQQQNNRLTQLNLELQKTIESKENLPEEIKNNLNKLILDFDKLDKNIAEELISISSLIEINEKPKAIFSLSKIIENLLKKVFIGKLNFVGLIEKAREEKLLTTEECHFVNGIRTIRNKEGHELNVTVESHLTASSFMIGIGIISKLKLLPTTHKIYA
tara:strand:- start:957 stop:1577 length:621 start_codon:yes stop_codon:yes gene_type:complete